MTRLEAEDTRRVGATRRGGGANRHLGRSIMTEKLVPVPIDQIKEGDLIVATNGELSIRGPVSPTGWGALGIGTSGLYFGRTLGSLSHEGYTFEKVVPVMPDEPGHYWDRFKNAWLLTVGTRHKRWVGCDGHRYTLEEAMTFGPFTKAGE